MKGSNTPHLWSLHKQLSGTNAAWTRTPFSELIYAICTSQVKHLLSKNCHCTHHVLATYFIMYTVVVSILFCFSMPLANVSVQTLALRPIPTIRAVSQRQRVRDPGMIKFLSFGGVRRKGDRLHDHLVYTMPPPAARQKKLTLTRFDSQCWHISYLFASVLASRIDCAQRPVQSSRGGATRGYSHATDRHWGRTKLHPIK
jgi:hypothetical protein